MKIISLILFIGLFYACIEHTKEVKEDITSAKQIDVEIKYARGFNVDVTNKRFTKISIQSNGSVYDFSDSIFIPHHSDFESNGRKTAKSRYSSLALQSSTYLAYLDIIGKIDAVKGLSGVQYVNSDYYTTIFDKNKIKEISVNGKIQMESLLSINPDLFLIYPFELDNVDDYEKKEVQTLLITEYLENTALGRLEWIKLFGLIFGEYEKAESYFLDIENKYTIQKQKVNAENTVFFNLPYNDNWAMPASNSITANLVKDAGFKFVYSDSTHDNSVRPKETVWHDVMQSEYWIIIAARPNDFTLKDLKAEAEIYKEFRSVKKGKVIFCNTATTNYFTKGVVEPDILLKELILAKENIENETLKYFRILR